MKRPRKEDSESDLSSSDSDDSDDSVDEDGHLSASSEESEEEFSHQNKKPQIPNFGRILPEGFILRTESRGCIQPDVPLVNKVDRCPCCLCFVEMREEYWLRATCRLTAHLPCEGKHWVCCVNCVRKTNRNDTKAYNKDPAKRIGRFFAAMLANAQVHAASRMATGRIQAGVFKLVEGDLFRMWEYQQGKCAYSGLAMQFRRGKDWFASLERLDPQHGYLLGNIALVAHEFNGRSQITQAKLAVIRALPDQPQPLDPVWLERQIEEAKHSRKAARIPVNGPNGEILFRCLLCHIGKPEKGFHKGRPACIICSRAELLEGRAIKSCLNLASFKHLCLRCNKRQDRSQFSLKSHQKNIQMVCTTCQPPSLARVDTLRGKLGHLLANSRESAKQRANTKFSRKFRNPLVRTQVSTFSLTYEDLLHIYEKQGGLCEYSGIKLEISGEWVMSLERLDELKGYARDNIVLVCHEFNTSAQWSRDKFTIAKTSISSWIMPPPFTEVKPVVPEMKPVVPTPPSVREPAPNHEQRDTITPRRFSIPELEALKAAKKAGITGRQACHPFLVDLARDFSKRLPCEMKQLVTWLKENKKATGQIRKRARLSESPQEDVPYVPLMQHTPVPIIATNTRKPPRMFSRLELDALEKSFAEGASHYNTSSKIWDMHATAFSNRIACEAKQIRGWLQRKQNELETPRLDE